MSEIIGDGGIKSTCSICGTEVETFIDKPVQICEYCTDSLREMLSANGYDVDREAKKLINTN